ncbi:leucine-rich repeat-containing protein let-4-like [Anopheles stephensi]|uniref:leucine-rich repeat-containing protein let-4-like n=1 Tax=Anopheles stephensi TaxID=30069 RepID=UPI00165893B1|nr:leucine-rich repeat-containing protein let-4-like [Anopheles stephensi]
MSCVWLPLLLLLQASFRSAVALQFSCMDFECSVRDWNPMQNGAFTLVRESKQSMFLTFINLQTMSLNMAMLQEKGMLENSTRIRNSPVQSIYLPAAIKLGTLTIDQTPLLNVTFEQNNTCLDTLVISDSQLREVPGTVAHLLAVLRIDITVARIRSIDFALFARLPRLEILTLNFNFIHRLEYSASADSDFPELRELYISNNRLTTVNFTHFRTMHALESLYLSSNQIRHVQDSPLLGARLRFLDLSCNSVVHMSTCNWTVGSLLNFAMYNNSLVRFPACLEETMPEVRYLQLSFNSFSHGSDIGRLASLEKLQILDVGYNRITRLALDTLIPSLKYLNLEHNPIVQLSVGVANDGLAINVRCGAIEEFDPANVTHSVIALEMGHCPLDCSWDRRGDNERAADARTNVQCVRNDVTDRDWCKV